MDPRTHDYHWSKASFGLVVKDGGTGREGRKEGVAGCPHPFGTRGPKLEGEGGGDGQTTQRS